MKRAIWILLLAGAGLLLWRLFREQAVSVEVVAARLGPVRAFVEEEAKTRVPRRYVLSAPVAGRLRRIERLEGDPVAKGEVVAEIDPLPLESRVAEAEAEMRAIAKRIEGVETRKPKREEIDGARAMEERAREMFAMAERERDEGRAASDRAESDARREEALLRSGAGSPEREEQARLDAVRATERLRALEAQLRVREVEIRAAALERRVLEARLEDFEWEKGAYAEEMRALEAQLRTARDDLGRTRVLAPEEGVVLQRFQESETVVAAGAPILETGSLRRLEVEADFLSEDAARMRPGMKAEILGRALGGRVLATTIARIHPYAFTKISSLGVEQQRTTVVLAFPEGEPLAIGDRFRVDVRVVLEERERALLVPEESLFRHDGRWHLFVAESGRARMREVEPGIADGSVREIRKGLSEGERVVLHPGDAVRAGTKLSAREREPRAGP